MGSREPESPRSFRSRWSSPQQVETTQPFCPEAAFGTSLPPLPTTPMHRIPIPAWRDCSFTLQLLPIRSSASAWCRLTSLRRRIVALKDLNKQEERNRRLKLLVRHPTLKLRMRSPHLLLQRSIGYSLANSPLDNCKARPCLLPQPVSKKSPATKSRSELVALELVLLFTQTRDDLDQAVLTLPARTGGRLLEISALILGPQLRRSRRAFPCGCSRLRLPHYRRWFLNTWRSIRPLQASFLR
mmetsp:Transcript_11791/g.33629  ORF Transcript_11791/g.33629 Transcript_11791/m.33629 type:complete len:242 (-) Transcript_11791:4439-5164(-)